MASSLVGLWYRVDTFSGRFIPLGDAVAAASSPGDSTVCVTSVTDTEPMVCQALNAAANVPSPIAGGRWTVVWATLKAAWQGSTRASLSQTTA